MCIFFESPHHKGIISPGYVQVNRTIQIFPIKRLISKTPAPRLQSADMKSADAPPGIGAVVISPTRELALQTFQCLADIGSKHDMSAGLIIGGTTFEREQANIPYTNILICTPGRLLQHLDETPNFDCMNLRVLVLDEADRMMDLGFSKAMDAIVQVCIRMRVGCTSDARLGACNCVEICDFSVPSAALVLSVGSLNCLW